MSRDDHRGLFLKPLREASKTGADGFDQHFGIPSAFHDRPWAVPWTCTRPDSSGRATATSWSSCPVCRRHGSRRGDGDGYLGGRVPWFPGWKSDFGGIFDRRPESAYKKLGKPGARSRQSGSGLRFDGTGVPRLLIPEAESPAALP
ncbi:hypothetical protein [Amycolatopsis sp. cmx-11-51]|uniref:hypothetical protein n=1 Tax=unclassified Amycolatopsis TaxID=2618356 RepID=UPI0039E2D9F3